MHFFFIPLAKAVSVCYISAWRPEVSHISSASFVLQVPGKRRSSPAWEFSPFGQLWRQLFWDLPQLPTIDFFSICCLQTKGQLIVFSGSIFIWGDFHFFFSFAPFCLIYFVSSTCFELMWEGRKKMLMISVAIGFSKRLETHDTTCFNLKDVS